MPKAGRSRSVDSGGTKLGKVGVSRGGVESVSFTAPTCGWTDSLHLSVHSSQRSWNKRAAEPFVPRVNYPPSAAIRAAPCATSPESAELIGIVIRAQAGDLGAQSELVRRYTRRISGFLRRIIPQRHAVEDLIQIVFIKMVRRLGVLRDPAVFENWLFAMSRNTAIDFIRRQRCRPMTISDDLRFMAAPAVDSEPAVAEIMTALDRAVARLRPKDRQLVMLIVQGNSYRVVAEREGISVGAVKLRLHRLRPFLRLSVSEAIGAQLPSTKKWRPPSRDCLAA
jgi:RNA polymerase sigma-70 factor, ECF subfamily